MFLSSCLNAGLPSLGLISERFSMKLYALVKASLYAFTKKCLSRKKERRGMTLGEGIAYHIPSKTQGCAQVLTQ